MRAKIAKAIRKMARTQTTIMFDSFNRKSYTKTSSEGKLIVVHTYFRDKGTYKNVYKRLKKEYLLGSLTLKFDVVTPVVVGATNG